MSHALNRSSAIWHFERSNAIEIHDEITFDFYMRLPCDRYNICLLPGRRERQCFMEEILR